MLRALAGLVPAPGTIRLIGHGEPLTAPPRGRPRRRPRPPAARNPSALTVAEYVLLGRTPHIGLPRRARREHDRIAAARAVARLDLRGSSAVHSVR